MMMSEIDSLEEHIHWMDGMKQFDQSKLVIITICSANESPVNRILPFLSLASFFHQTKGKVSLIKRCTIAHQCSVKMTFIPVVLARIHHPKLS
jgi:hypothetical protein